MYCVINYLALQSGTFVILTKYILPINTQTTINITRIHDSVFKQIQSKVLKK